MSASAIVAQGLGKDFPAPGAKAKAHFSLRCRLLAPAGAPTRPRFINTMRPRTASPRLSRSAASPLCASIKDASTSETAGVSASATERTSCVAPPASVQLTLMLSRCQAVAWNGKNVTSVYPEARNKLSAMRSAAAPWRVPVSRCPMAPVLQRNH